MIGELAVVTGAGGFLGKTLVARLLADGVQVRVVTRSNVFDKTQVSVVRADIRDSDQLTRAFREAKAVFHLAAHTHDLTSLDDSRLQEEITLGGTLSALAAAESAGVEHFVFASSLAVFGDVGATQVDEKHSCAPSTPYGRAKLRAERAVSEFAHRTGAFASCIRPAMIYGVGCPGNLPRMIRAIERGTFPPIPEFGNRRSMIAVDDVAQALIRAWKVGVRDGHPFIVTDGRGYSTRELYDLVRGALGRSKRRIAVPAAVFRVAARFGDGISRVAGRRVPFDTSALSRLAGSAWFSADRAARELGFSPTITLPDLLPAIIDDLTGFTSTRSTIYK